MGCNNGLLGNKIISIMYFFGTIHVQLAGTEDYLEVSPSAMSMPLTAAVNDDDVLHLPSLSSRTPISSSDASSREEPVRRSSLIFLYSSQCARLCSLKLLLLSEPESIRSNNKKNIDQKTVGCEQSLQTCQHNRSHCCNPTHPLFRSK